MHRFRIKIVGESGSGLLSTGEIITNALEAMGFNIVADREYPSLIKGGASCYTLNISTDEIYGLSQYGDVMIGIDKPALEAYHRELRDGGLLVYGYDRVKGLKVIIDELEGRGCEVMHIEARELAESLGGNALMVNVILAGMLWKAMGLDYKYIEDAVTVKFASKPKLLELDLKCLDAGFSSVETKFELSLPHESAKKKRIILDGNKAVALGAVQAGCRAYFAYPMSPSSSILAYMKQFSHKTGMHVQQVEDEISVAQMAVGAMYAGARACFATSGGGYDLMTETVSMAGITETPLVGVICQRPGPGTGLPTWTGQGDLNLALYSSHGEFPRVVMAVSDPEDAFELMQHAFNLAEKYQVVALVLSEKVICESLWSIEPFKTVTIEIERGLVEGKDLEKLENSDRFKVTENGLSKRWVPGESEAYYFANGDEHWEDGSLTEKADEAGAMYEKRMKKLELVARALPEPDVYGDPINADISFVGWGSSRNTMRDVIAEMAKEGVKVNYLHYSYVWPLKTERLEQFFEDNKNVHLIEGNYNGQLGDLIRSKTDLNFAGRLLKWNGRPFFTEDVKEYISGNR